MSRLMVISAQAPASTLSGACNNIYIIVNFTEIASWHGSVQMYQLCITSRSHISSHLHSWAHDNAMTCIIYDLKVVCMISIESSFCDNDDLFRHKNEP